MRKLKIIEIENSFLNFFTPAAIIAASLFLFTLFELPLNFLYWMVSVIGMNLNLDLMSAIIANLTGILVSLIVYMVFIPRLKLKSVKYRQPSFTSLLCILPVFCIIIFFRILIRTGIEFIGGTIYFIYPSFMYTYFQLQNQLYFSQFILYQFIIIPISSELIYRRTVIPLLEDRGLAPVHSVILSSLGFCLLFLPVYLQTSNYLGTIFWFGSTFLFGLATGVIYIITRNILYSIIYAIIYYTYRLIGDLGSFFGNDSWLFIQNFMDLIITICALICIIYMLWQFLNKKTSSRWIKVLKISSEAQIRRGVIGYFAISILLVLIQLFTIEFIIQITYDEILLRFVLNLIFYLIAFSIPFWLSITTEYALS